MAAQEELQAVPQDDALDLQSRALTALPALPAALRVINLTRNRITDLVPCGALVAVRLRAPRALHVSSGGRKRRGAP